QASAQQRSEFSNTNLKLQQEIGKTLHSLLLQRILQAADDIQGGFGNQAKFPMVAQLNYLLSAYQQQPQDQIAHFLLVTLEQMASQGLRDHIGGGFFRYTVDPDWQTPHFEKMLYDNAQLASLYLDAAKVFKRQDFELIGRDTLDFMLREMSIEKGGMVASLSAVDEHNVEGGYYLWSKQALEKSLTKQEYDIVYLLWGLQAASHFEAGYLPVYAISPDQAAKTLGKDVDEVMRLLSGIRTKLYTARQSRVVPVDDKQLAAWNGLALSAMIKGAQLTDGKSYRRAAQKLRHFLANRLWDGRRLVRATSGFNEIAPAGLEDYAYAARGLLEWALFENSEQDQQLAKQWLNIAWQRFYTSTGWQLSDQLSLPNVFGSIVVEDNPMPSPSASLIGTSLQVAELTHDERLKQLAIGALAVSQDWLKQQPFAYPTQIKLLASLQSLPAQNSFERAKK
ncbi:thioredoxin domain-containing protein, partial [Kaarinaea lacus]